jgi:PAS domain S-box-containing protein
MADSASTLPSGARILDSFTDAFFWLDRGWRFGFVNSAAEGVLRQPREQLLGRVIWDAYPEMQGTVFEREYRRAASEQATVVFEAFYEPFGAWFELRLYPADEGLSVHVSNISERKRAELRVSTAEVHYRRLVTHTPVAVYVLDGNGCFTEVNPAGERLVARPAVALFGTSYERIVAPASVDAARTSFTQIAQGLVDDVELEVAIRRPSGEERLVAVTATVIRDGGRFQGVHGVARDITDERAVQAALADRQRQMQQVLDALPFGVSLVDLTGQQIWSNPALDRIWGSARPLGPDRYRAYVGWAADSAARLPDHEWPIVRALRGETVSSRRIDIQAFDGTRKSTVVSAVPLRNAAGALTGALAVQEDVTAAQALEARQRLLATVLDGLPEGVCVLTPSGHALYANRRFAEILGIDPAHVEGLHPDDLGATSDAARQFPLMIRTALETGRSTGRASHTRQDDGRLVTLDVVLSRVQGSGGDDLLFGLIQDVKDNG